MSLKCLVQKIEPGHFVSIPLGDAKFVTKEGREEGKMGRRTSSNINKDRCLGCVLDQSNDCFINVTQTKNDILYYIFNHLNRD